MRELYSAHTVYRIIGAGVGPLPATWCLAALALSHRFWRHTDVNAKQLGVSRSY